MTGSEMSQSGAARQRAILLTPAEQGEGTRAEAQTEAQDLDQASGWTSPQRRA